MADNSSLSWIYALLQGFRNLNVGGQPVALPVGAPPVSTLNIVGGTAAYNTTTQALDLTVGSGGTSGAPLLFAGLSSLTAPVTGHGYEILEGYTSQGDSGNGKVFVWVASSTATPNTYTVSQITAVNPGRWVQVGTTINVKDFGAKGDTTQDDYLALNTALQAWAAAQAVGAGFSGGLGGVKLKIPAGNYSCSQPLVVSNVTGGVIEGDGMYSTLIQGTVGGAGAFAQLELRDCTSVTVRDLGVVPWGSDTTVATSNITVGATSFTVASAAGLSAGQRVALMTIGGACEEVHIASIAGAVVTIAGQGCLYAHSIGDYIVSGCVGAVGCSTYYQSSGKTSHGNHFDRVLMNQAQLVDCLYGFTTGCLGGGPVPLKTNISIGDTGCTVWDATQMYIGEQIQIYDGYATPEPVKTLTAVNKGTGVISWSPATATNTHTAGSVSIVAASDANNDEHVLDGCVFQNESVAGVGIVGLNSLNNTFNNCEVQGGVYAIVSARQGGSFKWVGGDSSGHYVDWEIGGIQARCSSVSRCASEANGRCFITHSQDQNQGIQMWFDHYDKKGVPAAAANLFDVTSAGIKVTLDACNIAFSAASGYTLAFRDTFTTGEVVLQGKCQIGASSVTLNGVLLVDHDSFWSTTGGPAGTPPVESLSNGGGVRAIAASYFTPGLPGTVERRPTNTLTLVNGNNDAVALSGDADLVATGPTGAYVLKGFSSKPVGQRVRIKFNINQQLTVKNNSSAGTPILTGTGADVIFAAPGQFLILDFWCDGTNWNVV